MKTALLSTTLAAAFCLTAAANNIQIANVAISDQDSVTKTANIGFDLSWENSWRLSTGPANWDAAWVFVKFHNGDNNWRHAKLAVSAAAHTVPAGATLSTGLTDGTAVGAFVHRSGNGSGNIAWTGVKLKWNYGADGVLDSAIVSVDVQAIEMVYVPQGAFYLGDGVTNIANGEDGFSAGSSRNQPYQVTAAGQLEIGDTAAEITVGPYAASASNSIYPSILPNGFAPFYCMKYEVSQGQYARFANMQSTYAPFTWLQFQSNPAKSRQRFTGTRPNFAAVTPDRAYGVGGNVLGEAHDRIKAYLAWTGLRPMSEMEYQKACRGPVFPVAGEFAWGTAVAASLPYGLTGDGTATEAAGTNYNPNAGNCWIAATSNYQNSMNDLAASVAGVGPCRVGMSARAAYTGTTSARIQAGASFWGIMDLTGNVSEPVLRASPADRDTSTTPAQAAGNPTYIVVNGLVYRYEPILFRGSHGNGTLPPPVDWGGTSTSPLQSLGGNYSTAPRPVSQRREDSTLFYEPQLGIRGVRSGS